MDCNIKINVKLKTEKTVKFLGVMFDQTNIQRT